MLNLMRLHYLKHRTTLFLMLLGIVSLTAFHGTKGFISGFIWGEFLLEVILILSISILFLFEIFFSNIQGNSFSQFLTILPQKDDALIKSRYLFYFIVQSILYIALFLLALYYSSTEYLNYTNNFSFNVHSFLLFITITYSTSLMFFGIGLLFLPKLNIRFRFLWGIIFLWVLFILSLIPYSPISLIEEIFYNEFIDYEPISFFAPFHAIQILMGLGVYSASYLLSSILHKYRAELSQFGSFIKNRFRTSKVKLS